MRYDELIEEVEEKTGIDYSRAYGVVKAASIDSNQTDRDAHLPLEATVKGAHRDPWGNDRVGMRARGTINRKDFGSPGNRCSRAAPSSSVKGARSSWTSRR